MGSTPRETLAPAIRRFPDRAESVVRLAGSSEAFHDMCEELAAAEDALAGLAAGRVADAEARRRECEGWIERLTGEMSRALGGATVLAMPSRRRP